jgi:hypothetical protein
VFAALLLLIGNGARFVAARHEGGAAVSAGAAARTTCRAGVISHQTQQWRYLSFVLTEEGQPFWLGCWHRLVYQDATVGIVSGWLGLLSGCIYQEGLRR